MATTQQNIETVKGIYAAFGRGDIPAILEHISDDVDWETGDYDTADIPWLRPGRGKAQAMSFFETVRGFEFSRFDVKAVAGDGDYVVGLVSIAGTWRPTGGTIDEALEPHIWRFDASGKVAAFRHAVDTRQHARAAQGKPAA